MRLRTKFAIVLLVVTVVLSAGVYGGLEMYKNRLVSQTRADVNETAVLTGNQLDASIRQRKDFIGFVASRPEAARFGTSERFLDEFVDNTRFFAAQLIAANGTIVDFHGDITQETRRESIGADVGNRPYVREALTGEVYVSRPEYTNATGKYLVIFSAPIFEDRRVKGVLAASMYLDTQTLFDMLTPLSTADQAVRVTAGSIVLYEPWTTFERSIEQSVTLEETGWTVTVIRDRSGLIDQLRTLAIAQGVGIFLVMLLVVSFGVWEYRLTLEQTLRLLEGFSALKRGEYDYSLSLASATEWEQISDGFNDLSNGLARRERDLQRHGQRLEVLNRVLRHNVRNTAGVILGYSELIRNQAEDEVIGRAADRIDDTVAELTSLSDKARQVEAMMEDDPDRRVPIEVTGIVSSVLSSLEDEFPAVEMTSSLPEEAWVTAAPSVRAAIENVCENACKHTEDENPRVSVDVEVDEERVRVVVTDNGPGIPDQERLVLSQGHETPLQHGSGLGLWIVEWTVEQSGGNLAFSERDPQGTIVTMAFERARDMSEDRS